MFYFLRWLGRGVYGGVVPVSSLKGAERYLEDCYKQMSFRVAMTHTLLALIMCFSPWFFLTSWKCFPFLSASEKENQQLKMIHSRFYFWRLVAQGVRGHALIAVFRDEEARAKYLDANRFLKPSMNNQKTKKHAK